MRRGFVLALLTLVGLCGVSGFPGHGGEVMAPGGLPVLEADTGFLSAHCITLCGDLGVQDGTTGSPDGIPDFTIVPPDGGDAYFDLLDGSTLTCSVTAPIRLASGVTVNDTITMECVYISDCATTEACMNSVDGWTDATTAGAAERVLEMSYITIRPDNWEALATDSPAAEADGHLGSGFNNTKTIDPREIYMSNANIKHVGRATQGPMHVKSSWFEAMCTNGADTPEGSRNHTEVQFVNAGNGFVVEDTVYLSYYSTDDADGNVGSAGGCDGTGGQTGSAQIFFDHISGTSSNEITVSNVYIDGADVTATGFDDFGPVFSWGAGGTWSANVSVSGVEVINYDNVFNGGSYTCGGAWTWGVGTANTLNGTVVNNPCP